MTATRADRTIAVSTCQGVFAGAEDRTQSDGRKALEGQRKRYEEAKAELVGPGFVLQGSVTERWVVCRRTGCRCNRDPGSRRGPFYQWSWKAGGKTSSIYLSEVQAELCRQWVANQRRVEKILRQMREITKCVPRLHGIRAS